MRFTIDEYSTHFKMSKEMISSKLKAKKLNYIIENGTTYIIVTKSTLSKEKPKPRPKTTVATVIALYQRENTALKEKVMQLEIKIDKLIGDKEQMLRDERDKIEQIYTDKDTQLKNILELVNSKIMLEKEQNTICELESFNVEDNHIDVEQEDDIIELKAYLKSLNIKSSQRKMIKKRFLAVYDSDIRIKQTDGKLYLNFSKFDYSDLLG